MFYELERLAIELILSTEVSIKSRSRLIENEWGQDVMKLIYRGLNYRRPLGRKNLDNLETEVKYRGVAVRLASKTPIFRQSLVLYKYRGVNYLKRYF